MSMDISVANDISAIGRIDSIPFILDLCCRNTGLRFAAVARVTDTSWTACAVRDEIQFGLVAGGELDLKTTICDEIRASGKGVIIDQVSDDPIFCEHHTPRQYGFQSYISIPIVRPNGTFFGTLCALDPEPAKLKTPEVISMFEGFSQLIGLHLDAQDRIAESTAALEEAGKEGAYREQFIAILGHDLRNPLASIEAGARMLSKADIKPRESTIVSRMLESCSRMSGLVSDMLDLARGRLGKGVPLSFREGHDLEASLGHVISELRMIHPDRTVDEAIVLGVPVKCDVPRIAQLLSNLLGNALSHGDPRKPVRVTARSDSDGFVIDVANGGDPIPAERLPTLFAPFTDRNTGSAHDGLGLGLFIAGEIASAHNGRIKVTSTQDETRFTLIMPCSVGDASSDEALLSPPG